MKLTTVLVCVNDNPKYYHFIPYQIYFWNKFGIRFVAYFVGDALPDALQPYADHITLWNQTPHLNSVFVAQNLRIYAPSLLQLPDDEMVMITDMDMLPTAPQFYVDGLEGFAKDDFIHYNHEILHHSKEIFMAYNAAHPTTWAKAFDIQGEADIIQQLNKHYLAGDAFTPGSTGWFIDQHTLYHYLLKYPHFKMLGRRLVRLETWTYRQHMAGDDPLFIRNYYDAHFHRSFDTNLELIEDARRQMAELYPVDHDTPVPGKIDL